MAHSMTIEEDPRSQIFVRILTGDLYTVLEWNAIMSGTIETFVVLKDLNRGGIWIRSNLGFYDEYRCVPVGKLRDMKADFIDSVERG